MAQEGEVNFQKSHSYLLADLELSPPDLVRHYKHPMVLNRKERIMKLGQFSNLIE